MLKPLPLGTGSVCCCMTSTISKFSFWRTNPIILNTNFQAYDLGQEVTNYWLSGMVAVTLLTDRPPCPKHWPKGAGYVGTDGFDPVAASHWQSSKSFISYWCFCRQVQLFWWNLSHGQHPPITEIVGMETCSYVMNMEESAASDSLQLGTWSDIEPCWKPFMS